jgi:phospholipid:diacylglycerol acyltransferase
MAKTDKLPTSWSNPLEATLPNAPDMKIYCLYGVGKSTERSYSYNRMSDLTPQILDQRPGNVSDETGKIPNIYIDTTVHDDKLGISYGIHQGDG